MAGERGGRRDVAFTVDVEGDWAGRETRGIREALPRLIDLLDRHGATSTFFVVGEVATLVRGLVDPAVPHEVGSHGRPPVPPPSVGASAGRCSGRTSGG